jgi:molybdopterin molybdotransferase
MNSEMLSFEQALEVLLTRAKALRETETLDLLEAHGRILAEPVIAPIDVPPHDNSAMDGYALRCEDYVSGQPLVVAQRITAGAVGEALQPGTAARIFTGAPIPNGCNAVVMQERCRAEGDRVWLEEAPRTGQNIRLRGEDIQAGSQILPAGKRLSAADQGLAASVGVARVEVLRPLKVAVFFTGDELTMPGESLRPGAIYNSNRFVLRSLLGGLGCEVTDLGTVRDTLEDTVTALRAASTGHDVIITCGGVSVGEEDHVKAAVMAAGSLDVWKIAIKPGKPLAYGRVGEADFIGLPGNPVSSLVTFLTLVRPFLLARMGSRNAAWKARSIQAAFDWPKPDARREFLRVRLDADGRAVLYPNQGAGVLSSCAWAEGLVDNPPRQAIRAGDLVSYLSFAEMESCA